MSSFQVLKPNEFNPDSVAFSALKKNANNAGKTVFMNLDKNKRIMIQFPVMKAPFGFSSFTDEASGKTSYSIPLTFDRNSPEACELREKLNALDEMVTQNVETNSKEWLGKKYNSTVIKEALYKPIVTQPKDEQYDPNIKIKVACKQDGSFIPKFYSSAREQVTPDIIEKGQRVVCIVSISGIWFVDNKFGVSTKLEQCLIKESDKLPAFAFRDEEPEGEVEEEDEIIDDDY